jgi:hypothetical protein
MLNSQQLPFKNHIYIKKSGVLGQRQKSLLDPWMLQKYKIALSEVRFNSPEA